MGGHSHYLFENHHLTAPPSRKRVDKLPWSQQSKHQHVRGQGRLCFPAAAPVTTGAPDSCSSLRALFAGDWEHRPARACAYAGESPVCNIVAMKPLQCRQPSREQPVTTCGRAIPKDTFKDVIAAHRLALCALDSAIRGVIGPNVATRPVKSAPPDMSTCPPVRAHTKQVKPVRVFPSIASYGAATLTLPSVRQAPPSLLSLATAEFSPSAVSRGHNRLTPPASQHNDRGHGGSTAGGSAGMARRGSPPGPNPSSPALMAARSPSPRSSLTTHRLMDSIGFCGWEHGADSP